MVQLMNSGNLRSESDTHCRPVKLEIEDSLEEEHSPFNKRSKLSPPFQQQWSMGMNSSPIPPPTQYNPLDEPSPLGLRLRKSPSLLDLIQMRLSQGNAFPSESSESTQSGKKKEAKGTGSGAGSSSSSDNKLKASNFPASLLRIGTWECVSRYEGDLVAKCYFAKHKLVWEVLDGGLKSKMEIQWSDIMALKANLPDNEPGTLDIVLTRQPLFFRETNPQPRKHTLWQATADFTGGQASINRRHFLQCPQGLLNKHFEKLIQCDPRLNWLSQQPEIVLESPYFEPKGSIFEDPNETKCHGFDPNDSVSTFSGFRDAPSPSAVQSSSSKSELWDPVGRTSENLSQRTPSPSSVMDPYAAEVNSSREAKEAKVLSHFNQLKVPGLHPSMSMSDLVSHLGNCLSEQMMSGDPLSSEGTETKGILEDIAQYLLSDSQLGSSSDEKCLMSRVNSLCCLLQKDPVQNSQVNSEVGFDKSDYGRFTQPQSNPEMKENKEFAASGSGCDDSAESKQATGMSKKDSLGDLLLHLPRIASLPQFLFNIPEDGENQAR